MTPEQAAVPLGREEPFRTLLAALVQSSERTAVATVAGEAGIGKTTLVDALAARAGADGHLVLRGTCTVVAAEPIQYAALAQALRGTQDAQSLPDPDDRAQLFEQILRRISAQPTDTASALLLIEDVHWADAGTLELVAFLARNLPGGHLIVLTYRDDEPAVDPRAQFVLDSMLADHRVQRIKLRRLTEAATAELVMSARGRPATDREAHEVYERSGGNPFIAVELANALNAGALPDRLHDVLLVRTRTLSSPALRVIEAMGVLGRPVEHDLLHRVVALPSPAFSDAVRECVTSGLLIVDLDSSHYRFRHVLSQDAILSELLPGIRRELHATVAAALGDRTPIGESVSAAAEWASHWYASGHAAQAASAALQAAAVARRGFAVDETWRQLRRAVELLTATSSTELASGTDLPAVLEQASDAARAAGDAAAALTLSRQAMEAATEPGDLARTAERLGRCLWDVGESHSAADAYEAAAKHAAIAGAHGIAVTITSSQARLAMQVGDYTHAIALATTAIHDGKAAGTTAEVARALATLGMAEVFSGDLADGVMALREAVEASKEHGDIEERRRATSNLAYALLIAGQTTEACDLAVAGLAQTRRYNTLAATGASLVSNTQVLLRLAGRWDEADQLFADVVEQGMTDGQALLVHVAQAELDISRGHLANARANLDRAAALSDLDVMASVAADLDIDEAELALARDKPDQAARFTAHALAILEGHSQQRSILRACEVALRAEITHARQTRRPTDQVNVAHLEYVIADAATLAISPELEAIHAACLAEASRTREPNPPGPWQTSAQHWATIERPYEEALAQLQLAETSAPTDRDAAAAALVRCRTLATRMGCPPLLAAVSNLAQRARIKLEDVQLPHATAVTGIGALTAREREVLAQLATGHSNRQIATHLFLSPRTVGVHVSHIMAKLHASSRGEAVAIAHKQGFGTP